MRRSNHVANRSYLYSTNVMPGPNAKVNGRRLIGISEWSYDIPIVFKLLLSGNPKTCLSSIWDNQEEIALVGDYASGVKNLEGFLSKVTLPSAQHSHGRLRVACLRGAGQLRCWLVRDRSAHFEGWQRSMLGTARSSAGPVCRWLRVDRSRRGT